MIPVIVVLMSNEVRSAYEKMIDCQSKMRRNPPLRQLVTAVLSVLITAYAAQAKPDLIVSKIAMTRGPGGIFVERVYVTVTNGCKDTGGASHLQITFKDDAEPTSKPIYYVVSSLRSLRGGESQTVTFSVIEKKIVFGRHLIAEADIYKKIDEASEINNWRTVFPDGSGSAPSPARCLN